MHEISIESSGIERIYKIVEQIYRREKEGGLIKDNVVLSVAALKVKLTLRRPINQLVAQGIMPCK